MNHSEVERSIIFLVDAFRDLKSHKPTLLHSIRTGLFLLESGFDQNIVIAGFLHDVLEDTKITEKDIRDKFGARVSEIVMANTKNASIADPNKRREELIRGCCSAGQDAVHVKIADISDNYSYYTSIKDQSGIDYCLELKSYFLKYLNDRLATPFIKESLAKIS